MSLKTLMTSEFTEGYTPDELVDLLLEFRKNYRELENKNVQLERKIEKKDEDISKLKKDIDKVSKRNSILHNNIKKFNRKLTFKERLTGKIKF